MPSSLKLELADHIYQYLCHEAQHSDLPEAARESLTAASECIEQAYRLNNNTNYNVNDPQRHHSSSDSNTRYNNNNSHILRDELLKIFTKHKELSSHQQQQLQQKISLKYPLRNESELTSSMEKPDTRVVSSNCADGSKASTDPHNAHNMNVNVSSSTGSNNPIQGVQTNLVQLQQQQPQPQQQSSKAHSQHPISQLPMTTRKKLSHLRAHIKRQASKAAKSRLEKRSSVSAVLGGGSSHQAGPLGASFDASNMRQSGDGLRDVSNQQYSGSTDSPSCYLVNQSASSPTAGPSGHPDITSSGGSGGQVVEMGTVNIGAKPTSHHGHHHNSIHQKNFKQKLIALIKKFRTDGSDFDSEEQYREALERELMKAAAGRGSKAIEELLEEDIDVEAESGSEPDDWDNISESSTPKPSLRPFFSSTTLDKI